MPNVSIHRCRRESQSEKGERLVLDATVRGVERAIVVNVGRYEKRPTFMIENIGALGDYQAGAMNALLTQVTCVYARMQSSSSSETF